MSELSSIISALEKQRASLDKAISALRESEQVVVPKRIGRPPGTGKKGTYARSVDARQRQSEAMRASWAARKARGKKVAAKKVTAKASKTATKKGGLTPAGRKALSESLKHRWAAKKAG